MPSLKPKIEGICDKCSNPLTVRRDDTPAVIQNRLALYKNVTAPLADFYCKAGLLMEYKVRTGINDVPDIVEKKMHHHLKLNRPDL